MNQKRGNDFLPHDAPLREDVRRLGAMVGDMLADQEGHAFFTKVESIRRAAIRLRGTGESPHTLLAEVAGLSPQLTEQLTRAFATYFQVVNIAERVHRIRRRRDYERASSAPQPESLHAVLLRLKDANVGIDELVTWLARLDIEPVFTAHPTEAVRRTMLEKEQVIFSCLVEELNGTLTPHERSIDEARMRTALTSGWQTSDSSPARPRVQDELEHVGFYLGDPIYRVVPVFYEAFERAIEKVYGEILPLPTVLRFGSWVGGDMDGNPNVNAATIAATLRTQRGMVLDRYDRECAALSRELSQSTAHVQVDAAVIARIDAYRQQLPQVAATLNPRYADMPYRTLLAFVRARLHATTDEKDAAYTAPTELLTDIELIGSSLRANKGRNAGWFAVRRLLWRIRTFGFHLAGLDVRQDARVHAQALGVALADAQWESRTSGEQTLALHDYASGVKELNAPDEATGAMLDAVFDQLAYARDAYGVNAIGLYIISMARSAADVLAVLALARRAQFVDGEGHVPLDIAPLFETVEDLQQAPETIAALFADPVYRVHLGARDDRQTVMLGYSDSSKEGGIVASRWSLQSAQVELLKIAQSAGVAIAFFHGRGGSISRGGGKTTRAVIASPRGSVNGRLRVTEQGEVIHRKFGMRALALRTLEQTVGAVLWASMRPRPPERREAQWRVAIDLAARHGAAAYRALINTDGFMDYFRLATPIDVIERMTLGSRPSRRGSGGIGNLRAIPWVFAWTQNRAGITGWFGIGTALENAAAELGEDVLREMAQEWPFFRTMLDDVEMVMAKSDLQIATLFSQLAGTAHAVFFPIIQAEFARAEHWILGLKGTTEVLAQDPRLALSIRLRNPYVDPMSLMQVDLLARWRASQRDDDALLAALVATVNGIAQGLQNTG